jgi:hypothetical protein
MRNVPIPICLAIIILAMSPASAVMSTPNLDMSQKSAFADAGSIAFSPAPSIDVEATDIGQAASGNSLPVNITANVTQYSSASKTTESICGLEMSNFEIETLEVPTNGNDVRIMSVSRRNANFMYAPAPPCNYWISIIPTTEYLGQESPYKPTPSKQNTWVDGVYTLRLRYISEGNEIASTTFSFTIGGDTSWVGASQFHRVTDSNSEKSPRNVNPIDQLNPQPEPPKPSNPSF